MTFIPLNQLKTTHRDQNLSNLVQHSPHTVEELLKHVHRDDILVEPLTQELYRCKKVQRDTSEYWTDFQGTSQLEIQRARPTMNRYRPNSHWTFMNCCGAGNILNVLKGQKSISKPFIIMEEDPGFVLTALSLFDLCTFTSSRLVKWLVGDHITQKLQNAVLHEFNPYHLVSSDYFYFSGELNSYIRPLSACDTYETELRSLFQRKNREVLEILNRFSEHYRQNQFSRIHKIILLILKVGCWETISKEMAEGLQEIGKEIKTITFSHLNDLDGSIHANWETLHFKPDAIALVDFSAEPFFFDRITNAPIPKLIWFVDDVVNLPQTHPGKFDIAFPSDEALTQDLVDRGFHIGCEIPLASPGQISAKFDPQLECDLSFVGSIFDINKVRSQLPAHIVQQVQRIVDKKLQNIKRRTKELLQEEPFSDNDTHTLIEVLNRTILKPNMQASTVIFYYFNLEFIYARRIQIITALRDIQPRIYGPLAWKDALEPFGMASAYQGRYLQLHEAFDLYRSSRISLNIHSMDIHTTMNERDLEIPTCGGFLLTDLGMHAGDRLPEFFDPQTEIATYNTPEDAVRKAIHYLVNPNEREAIREAAYKRIQKQHTYAHRMKTMLECAEKTFPALL